jgi:hypothetical protein
MDTELYVGQALYAKNGDKVIVTSLSDDALTVAYAQKQYRRSADVLGKTLFASNPLEEAAAEDYAGDAVFDQETVHLRETQQELETFSGFLLGIDIGENGFVVGTRTGFDEVTKEELIAGPYFARMDIEIDDHTDRAVEAAYIGKKGVYHENRVLISDWRSEIGQKYYMKNVTGFNYNGFEYALFLRRALKIKSGVLTGYNTEFARAAYLRALGLSGVDGDQRDERITDPFLQDIIRSKHTQNTLTDIIESIQENQNAIITYGGDDSLVVQGCAGSGKTMILLHRLSFLKYRDRSLDLTKIKILTPNSLFSMYINDLSNSLELEKIGRLTVSEYYAELLARYYNIERSQLGRRCTPGELTEYRASLLATEKTAAGWPAIYSDSMREYIETETVNALGDFYENSVDIRRLGAILLDRLKYAVETDIRDMRTAASLKGVLQRVSASFEPYDKQLAVCKGAEAALLSAEQRFLEAKAALPNADALLEQVSRELVGKTPKLLEKYTERKSALMKRKTGGQAFPVQEIRECDFCLRAVVYEKAKHVFEVDRKLLRQEKDRIPFTEEEMALVGSALKQVSGFSFGTIEKAVLGEIERSHGVTLSFRNRVYARLLMNYVVFGKPAQGERLLCVDEGHDLYAGEYRLFALVNGGSVRFNIYGDVNQITGDGEGIGRWDTLQSATGFSLFTLNENYRNSAEIIEYSNTTLGFSTTNLGIGGDPVRALSFAGFIEHINDNLIGSRKLAVIVKAKTAAAVKKLRDRITEKLNLTEISPGEISLLTPTEAKGLEFDTCYVITEGMNRNEKYIAFTRALNELYVIASLR